MKAAYGDNASVAVARISRWCSWSSASSRMTVVCGIQPAISNGWSCTPGLCPSSSTSARCSVHHPGESTPRYSIGSPRRLRCCQCNCEWSRPLCDIFNVCMHSVLSFSPAGPLIGYADGAHGPEGPGRALGARNGFPLAVRTAEAAVSQAHIHVLILCCLTEGCARPTWFARYTCSMRWSKEFVRLIVRFAKKVAEIEGMSVEEALLNWTPLYLNLGLSSSLSRTTVHVAVGTVP